MRALARGPCAAAQARACPPGAARAAPLPLLAAPPRRVAAGGRRRGGAAAAAPPPQLDGPPPAPSTDAHEPRISKIGSPEEFDRALAANGDKLVVLMCKSTHCRPCKLFRPKYAHVARHYTDAVFLEVVGDETTELRGLMKRLAIKSTPTFKIYRGGKEVGTTTGKFETKLHLAMQQYTRPGEAGHGSFTLLEPEEMPSA